MFYKNHQFSVLKEGKSTLDAAYAGLLSRKMQWAEEKDNAMDEKAALEAKLNELKKELDTIKALLEQDRKAATIEKDNSAARLTKSEAVIAEKDIKIRKIAKNCSFQYLLKIIYLYLPLTL